MALTMNSDKMASVDRIFKLKIIDNKKPKSATGMIDTRLFNGENNIHVKKDPETNFWFFEYDMGAVPGMLKHKFTGYKAALKHAETYFKTRNIEIEEVST
jgi:hypothetical protein